MGNVEPPASGPRNSIVGLLFHDWIVQDYCRDLLWDLQCDSREDVGLST